VSAETECCGKWPEDVVFAESSLPITAKVVNIRYLRMWGDHLLASSGKTHGADFGRKTEISNELSVFYWF